MNRVAVLGQAGIEKYSLSPKIHGEFFRQMGIDGEYGAIPVSPENLEAKLAELQGLGYRGVNLTIPHKVNVLKYLTHVDGAAKAIGAVNTVLFMDGERIGYNTDAYGFMEGLKNWNGKGKVVIFGAGGASRAAVYGLRCADIYIVNRTDEKAIRLAKEFGCGFELWENRQKALVGASLVVNTTSAGMYGNPPLDIELYGGTTVYDVVYNPLVTPLLKQAKDLGLETIDGLGMLLNQAAKAFEIWFNVLPKIDRSLYENS